MTTNYQAKLTELQLTEQTISKSIKDRIKSIVNALGQLDKAIKDKNAASISEIESDIKEMDDDLCAALVVYAEKRPELLEKAKKMIAGRNKKNNPPAPAAPAPPSEGEQQMGAGGEAGGQSSPAAAGSEEKKEEGEGGGWGFLGLLAIAVCAVIGIKMYNNNK